MGIPERFLVSPEAFADAMTARWLHLGNTPSSRLQQLWRTMAATLAAAITAQDQKWRILQPPTGTGKTQGLCVYAALTITQNVSSLSPIGILVVTRTIQQADEIVETIRELVLPELRHHVVAKHSKHKPSIFALHHADVLVVTHAAYLLALGSLNDDDEARWLTHLEWQGGRRKLTVIDEALTGVVEQNQLTGERIRQVLRYVRPEVADEYPAQINAIRALQDLLDQRDRRLAKTEDDGRSRCQWMAWTEGHDRPATIPQECSTGGLRKALADLPYDNIELGKSSALDRRRIADRVDETLRDCEAVLKRWAYYHRKGRDTTLNSSQLLIPPDFPGAVVLDATATQNFHWQLLEDRAEVVPIPSGTRNYGNVTLHIARVTDGLGKGKMKSLAKTRVPRLLDDLETRLSPDRRVLLCLHKDNEHTAKLFAPRFAAYSVAHWGAIDGKNDWQDHDTAVLFGMYYRDNVWSTNAFFALQGQQDDEWLANPSWKDYANIHTEMQRRHLTVSLIQAMNRVRCRRVIDAEGNCPTADIFIVLRAGTEGDAILNHIREEMPGIVVEPWCFQLDGPHKQVRRGSSHEALLALMENRLPGEAPMSLIRTALSLSKDAQKALAKTLRDKEHQLTKALAEMGVRYVSTPNGRGGKSFLLKG
jgi:hypothetical protein